MTDWLRLPAADGTIVDYKVRGDFGYSDCGEPARSRIAFAAVHVVCDPMVDTNPTSPAAIDWDATMAFRHHVWSYGLGVAEAMDTAQRGMGLDWEAAKELIRRTLRESEAVGGTTLCGVRTDQLDAEGTYSIEEVEKAYLSQCEFVESLGGQVIIMPSVHLRRVARSPDDYRRVYSNITSQLARPCAIHWLGEAFDPTLRGYWGSTNLDEAADVVLDILKACGDRVWGLKLSLLDQSRELAMRPRLPAGVHMLTGDDFDYVTTIASDGGTYSDALLGAFDAIAPAASQALLCLDEDDEASFRAILEPTLPLSRHIFRKPTFYYKTGIVFLAYLNGHQRHFRMVGGLESGRSIVHLAQLFVLADQAKLLRDADLAASRMANVLAVSGIEQ
jgi:hypothetical protein